MARAAARVFDAMAGDYDRLEPWYEHLYDVLHPLLAEALAPREVRDPRAGEPRAAGGPRQAGGPRALDAGCGTGFQTALLDALGYESHGVDLSAGLLAEARRRLDAPSLALADLEALPYRDGAFDVVACCGSTLSFVDEPAAALRELARALTPGGRLFLECEHDGSLDLVWALVSALAGDRLGYGDTPAAAWRRLVRRSRAGSAIEYPGYGRLRLFTRAELGALLAAAGLRPLRWWGIHSVTNLIPSTVLHRARLGRLTAAAYRRLCALDARLAGSPVGPRLANSLVVLAEKL